MASPATPASPAPSEPPALGEVLARAGAWAQREPLGALAMAGSLGALVYFFGFFKVFTNGALTTARWAAEAWNAENNQEHGFLILPISLFLAWFHRDRLAAAEKAPSNAGIWVVAAGAALFAMSVRTLQPRFAVAALPVLLLGAALFLWGRAVARVLLFPCAFLLFMVPVGNLVQGTVSLQILVSSVCNVLASFIGIQIEASGTTITSLDGSFNFEIAEGCSGIRSLMAMTTLTALYVHFTQRELWKKLTIFAGSIFFAVVGNVGRIFTVILVARYISPELAGGLYHDWSGFVFFPVAVLAMTGFANLLNASWTQSLAGWFRPEKASQPRPLGENPKSEEGPGAPISYDY